MRRPPGSRLRQSGSMWIAKAAAIAAAPSCSRDIGLASVRAQPLRGGIIINLGDPVPSVAPDHMDDDVHRERQQVVDVDAGEFAPLGALLDQQSQLFEGEA